jgi:hypothetical protein
MAVEFQDFSFEVKAALNEKTIAWLYETANEIASQAQRNCSTDKEYSNQLKGSYRADVDEGAGEAQIGTPLEAGYWEEWGTGEYAAHGDGRPGWWVYIEGGSGYDGPTTHYTTRASAEAAAEFIRQKYKKNAVATNGHEPNYTLEKAFTTTKPKAIAQLEKKLKGL